MSTRKLLIFFLLTVIFSFHFAYAETEPQQRKETVLTDVICNETKDLEACDGQTVQIEGAVNKEAEFLQHPDHPLSISEQGQQSYIDTSAGQVTIVAKEKINCAERVVVIGKLSLPHGCITDVKSDCEKVIFADSWQCEQ